MHCLARRSATTTSLCITQISSKISKPKRFRRSSVRMLSPSPQRKSHCCLAIFYIAFAILFPYTLCTLARRNAATPSFGVAQICSKLPKLKCFRRAVVQVLPFSIHQYYCIRTVNASAGIAHGYYLHQLRSVLSKSARNYLS